MRKCRDCGQTAVETRREDHQYIESGLSNVIVKGMEIRECTACGARTNVLPRVTELHRTIAMALVRKSSRLASEEIRFLRKEMGWSGRDFASHMGVVHETVSRWENGHEPASGLADRLLRLMVIVNDKRLEDYTLDTLTAIDQTAEPAQMGLQDVNGFWGAAA